MEKLIRTIAKALVDHSDVISVRTTESSELITYELFVHAEDVGKIIGKHGRVIKAFRTVVISAAVPKNKRVMLEIASEKG